MYLLYAMVFVLGMFLAGLIALRMGDGSLTGFIQDHLMSGIASELPELAASVPVVSGPFVEHFAISLAGTVANAGRSATPEFQSVFQIDMNNRTGVFLASDMAVAAIPFHISMEGSSLRSVNGLWGGAPVGTHLVRLCADITHKVAEVSEENNCGPAASVTVIPQVR
ncbi:MAG: hypothetical protein RL681_168 [Candidatus Parcubacteria bacterium]